MFFTISSQSVKDNIMICIAHQNPLRLISECKVVHGSHITILRSSIFAVPLTRAITKKDKKSVTNVKLTVMHTADQKTHSRNCFQAKWVNPSTLPSFVWPKQTSSNMATCWVLWFRIWCHQSFTISHVTESELYNSTYDEFDILAWENDGIKI